MSPSLPAPLLSARGLTWATPTGRPVLEDVDVDLHEGEVLAVAGPSGCGKSTLLRALVLLQLGATGEIRWRGEAVTPATVRYHRQRVQWCAQRPVALTPSLGEDLALAREAAASWSLTLADQRALLTELGLPDLDLTQAHGALSGGEQQRVGLVRALTLRPRVLLLDEPVSALDPGHAARVEGVIEAWRSEDARRAILWIDHDAARRARVAHRTLELP